jgi:hypothetical protein
VDISSSTYSASSASVDEGGMELNSISNLSWELRGSLGPIKVHYGNSSMVFSFKDLGLHRLRLVVYDLAGNRNETELRVMVTDRINPTPTIIGPATVDEDTFINFVTGPGMDNDPYLGDGYGSILWRFTDRYGEADTVERGNATFIFPEPGIYNVTLIVTDRMENQGFATSSVLVRDITPPEVTIFGAVNLIEGSTGMYTFNATDNDPDFRLTWNATWTVTYLDDENESTPVEFTGSALSYPFEVKGNYSIALAVSDASGNVGRASIKVLVHEKAIGGGDGDDRSFPYLLMAVGTLIVICAAGIVVYLYIKNRPEISEVDWEDDDWDLDEEE